MHRAVLGVQPQARVALGARLRARRPQIELILLSRLRETADPSATRDSEYLHGLEEAALAALDYLIESFSSKTRTPLPVPLVLSKQARLAARSRVPLEDVLRRYFAGFHLLSEIAATEAQENDVMPTSELQRLLQIARVRFDQLVALVGEEYRTEAASRPSSSQEQLADRVTRMLAGEPLVADDLAYNFGDWHIGCVAAGPGADATMLRIARSIDCCSLVVRRPEDVVWGWLGSRRRLDGRPVLAAALTACTEVMVLALGEPAKGKDGWRLSHRQAARALPLAGRLGKRVIPYADVALLSTAMEDDLLAISLRAMFLDPLRETPGGIEVAAETLRVYFECDQTVSATAEALRIHRRTVTKRLRTIEEALGKPIAICRAELATALHLAEVVE